MKTLFLSLSKWQIILLCILSMVGENVIAQNATNTHLETEVFYYGIGLAVIILVVAAILFMQKAHRILGEHGQPLFEHSFPIFKRMTKASTTVAIIMILLVLWGIYSVVTYKVT